MQFDDMKFLVRKFLVTNSMASQQKSLKDAFDTGLIIPAEEIAESADGSPSNTPSTTPLSSPRYTDEDYNRFVPRQKCARKNVTVQYQRTLPL